MNFKRQWDSWGWLIPFVLVTVFFSRALLGREAFCGAADEHCAREWLSAVGSFSAVVFGMLSSFLIYQQIQYERRYHLENRRDNVRATIALAKNVRILRDHVEVIVNAYKNTIGNVPHLSNKDQAELNVHFKSLTGTLDDPIWRQCEQAMGPPSNAAYYGMLKARVDQMNELWGQIKMGPISQTDQDLLLYVSARAFGEVLQYARASVEIADRFLSDHDKI